MLCKPREGDIGDMTSLTRPPEDARNASAPYGTSEMSGRAANVAFGQGRQLYDLGVR